MARIRFLTRTAWCCAWALAAACGVEGGEAGGTVFRDSAGIAVVTNHGAAAPTGCISVAPDPEATIESGGSGGAPNPLLFQVRGGAVLEDGRIVLLNGGSQQLFFCSAAGSFLSAKGGKGSGPGEFLQPRWMGHGRADSLIVWDPGQRRLSVFDPDGRLVESPRGDQASAALGPANVSGLFADGTLFTIPAGMSRMPPPVGIQRLPEAYGWYDRTTGAAATVVEGRGMEMTFSDGAWFDVPFGRTDMALALGMDVVIGDRGEASLRVHDREGRLRRIVTWPSTPVAVTARDRSRYRQAALEASRLAAPPPEEISAATRPVFSSLTGDRLGWLWVGLYSPDWEPPANWLVFDRDGVLLCQVTSPARVRVLEIGERYLLGLLRNEDGEETVVKYGLRRGGGMGRQ